MRRWIFLLGSLLVLLLIFLTCALIHERAGEQKLGILDLYQRIEIGMTRERAEEILGPPLWPPQDGLGEEIRLHYLDHEYAERSLLPHESPLAPAGIFVSYRHGKLVEKSYNSQWVNERPRPWWRFW
jgi:hypothetical protein